MFSGIFLNKNQLFWHGSMKSINIFTYIYVFGIYLAFLVYFYIQGMRYQDCMAKSKSFHFRLKSNGQNQIGSKHLVFFGEWCGLDKKRPLLLILRLDQSRDLKIRSTGSYLYSLTVGSEISFNLKF